MPKLRETQAQKLDRAYRLAGQTIKKHIIVSGDTPSKAAKKIGVCKSTIYSRLSNAEDMSLRELVGLCTKYRIPIDEVL